MAYIDLKNSDLDMLKEMGNIGAGHAAMSLSTMVGATITVSVPRCEMIPLAKIADILGGPETVVLGILVQMSSEIEGFILIAQKPKDAARMMKEFLGYAVPKEELYNLDAMEPMREVGNILAGSYVSAIMDLTGLKITPSVPEMSLDMAMAIMNVPASVYGEMGDSVLLLDTEFGGDIKNLQGHLFLIPTMDSLLKLKKALLMD